MFYEFQGNSFAQARGKILAQVDINHLDTIGKNIFTNDAAYKNALTFLQKRPLYPLLSVLFNLVFHNETIAFLFPIYLAFLGSIILCYIFCQKSLGVFGAILVSAALVNFYPFIDWSTYFLTDTLGLFFWLLQLFFLYEFLLNRKGNWLLWFLTTMVLSLYNREQSILFVFILVIVYFLSKLFNLSISKIRSKRVLLFVIAVTLIYIGVSAITKQKNLLDSLHYLQNDYGLTNHVYTLPQTFIYLAAHILSSHRALIVDLTHHHVWAVSIFLSIVGIMQMFVIKRNPKIADILMLGSGLASYLSIFLFPVLSYRFFYPVVIAIAYFGVYVVLDYYQLLVNEHPKNHE